MGEICIVQVSTRNVQKAWIFMKFSIIVTEGAFKGKADPRVVSFHLYFAEEFGIGFIGALVVG